MDREEFADRVKEKIESEPIYYNKKDFIKENYKNAKKGIYFLYNDNNDVIYVGKVGEGEHTNFYDRMYGHGSGAHYRKSWFDEVKKFRFKNFPSIEKAELTLIERLMIYKNKQPKYNDGLLIISDYKEIIDKL